MSLNRDFFQRYYDTYNSDDPVALADFYAPNIQLQSADGIQVGREAILATYGYLIEHFEDRMTPDSMVIQGTQAAIAITDRFVAKKPVQNFLGQNFEPGDTLTLNLCGLYTVVDGRIQSIRIYAG